MRKATIAAVQLENTIGQAAKNMERLIGWVGRAAQQGVDIVIFPECCLTGYTTSAASEIAIPAESACVKTLEQTARERGIAVGYGFVERKPGGAPFITYVIASAVNPDERLVYRKTHLGTRERGTFTPGDDLPVTTIAGVRIGVQLCWEAHMPDITSTLRSKGAELVVMPHAGGPNGEHRLDLWRKYLPARALDNGLFIIACNATFTGSDNSGGGLAAYAPDGRRLAESAPAGESMLLVEIDGPLPRESPDDNMHGISYFDRRRPELYR